MEIKKEIKQSRAIKIIAEENGRVIGRAHLYLIYNDLHKEPYGLLEDVFVDEAYRGKGIGGQLVQTVIEEAKAQGCYKLLGTTRHSKKDVHEWYKHLGFKDFGIEFRMDIKL